jgi:hypothetical protein
VLGSTLIPAAADLHDLMVATIKARKADGWTVQNERSYGFVFCHSAGVRRMVAILQVDPTQPAAGGYRSQPAPA